MDNQIVIKKLSKDDEIPFELIYLADPSVEAVNDYLSRGTCYVGVCNNTIIGAYVLLPTRPFTVELVNLAVLKKFQGKGYGKMLIKHALAVAKEANYKIVQIGTGNSSINELGLYQKCGFSITHVDFDFFRKCYPEPIFENEMECRHMIRLSIDL